MSQKKRDRSIASVKERFRAHPGREESKSSLSVPKLQIGNGLTRTPPSNHGARPFGRIKGKLLRRPFMVLYLARVNVAMKRMQKAVACFSSFQPKRRTTSGPGSWMK